MPARLSAITKALKKRGGRVDASKSGSSHFKAFYADKMFPIAAHNGMRTEIADVYIRGLCREFGFDEKAFRKDL